MSNNTTGNCRICGKNGIGQLFDDWVKPTFTDWDKLQPGEIICNDCLFWFDESSEVLTKRATNGRGSQGLLFCDESSIERRTMSQTWSLERLKRANLGTRSAIYEAIPSTPYETEMKEKYPQLFRFEAISIGDDDGQALIIPLDDCSKETADLILKAIAAYQDGQE